MTWRLYRAIRCGYPNPTGSYTCSSAGTRPARSAICTYDSIAQRHEEILAARILEIVVFHSSAQTMLEFQGELPFAAIADPEKKLYAEFGVGKMSPRVALIAALSPRSWLAAGRALRRAPSLRGAAGKGEEHLGLPADFLIGPGGQVLAATYGAYVDDHWSVDGLLDLANDALRHMTAASPATTVLPPSRLRSKASRERRLTTKRIRPHVVIHFVGWARR